MTEPEVSLAIAMFYIGNGETSKDVTVSIDGAHIKTKDSGKFVKHTLPYVLAKFISLFYEPSRKTKHLHVEEQCVGCGKCVRACPRSLFELTDKRSSKLVYVGCMNKDKGALAMKVCKTSCIGCGKCVRTCKHESIIVNENLAHIDTKKCVGCEECISACPRNSITTITL